MQLLHGTHSQLNGKGQANEAMLTTPCPRRVEEGRLHNAECSRQTYTDGCRRTSPSLMSDITSTAEEQGCPDASVYIGLTLPPFFPPSSLTAVFLQLLTLFNSKFQFLGTIVPSSTHTMGSVVTMHVPRALRLPPLETLWKWPRTVNPHMEEIGQECLDWCASLGVWPPEKQRAIHEGCTFRGPVYANIDSPKYSPKFKNADLNSV